MISLLALAYVPPAPVVRRPFRSRALAMGTQVITDIDDTIKSSGGVAIPLGDEAQIYLGGVDTSYARNAFYPGVFQFGLEIARADAPPSGVPEKMAILTARAEEFKFALEIKQSSKLCVRFRQAGEGVGTPDWGVGPVLYGSVAEWICQERKGLRKYENFKLLRAAAAPDTRWVFCGDNGASEKDLEAAQMMISAFPGALRAVFLHAVSPTTQPAPLPEDTTFDGVPIRFFRTYATAARKAAELGLVDAAGAQRVYAAVQADMALDADNIGRGSANERLLLAELEAAAA